MISELDKYAEVHERHCEIEEFLEFLESQEVELARILESPNGSMGPAKTVFLNSKNLNDLVMKFLKIDPLKLEAERAQLLNDWQSRAAA